VKVTITIAVILTSALLLTGCGEKQDDSQTWNQKVDAQTATETPAQATVAPGQPGGEVLETFASRDRWPSWVSATSSPSRAP